MWQRFPFYPRNTEHCLDLKGCILRSARRVEQGGAGWPRSWCTAPRGPSRFHVAAQPPGVPRAQGRLVRGSALFCFKMCNLMMKWVWLAGFEGCGFTVQEACYCSLPPGQEACFQGVEADPGRPVTMQRDGISLSLVRNIKGSSL